MSFSGCKCYCKCGINEESHRLLELIGQNECDFDMAIDHIPAPIPLLTILREPQKTHRFRYQSEFKNESHGHLYGEDRSSKQPIMVKLDNWFGQEKAFIRCSLVTDEHEQHFHKLRIKKSGNESTQEYQDETVSQQNNWTAEFFGLSILRAKMNEVKARTSLNDQKWEVITLKFEAFSGPKGDSQSISQICEPVYSRRIVYQKEEMSIVKMIKNEGMWTGNEDICIFVKGLKEIRVDDIGILFFIQSGDYVCWSADAQFSPSDVHEKSAIVFKTPRYPIEITDCVQVQVKLYRKRYKDICSQQVTFTYLPVNNMIQSANSQSMFNSQQHTLPQLGSQMFNPRDVWEYSEESGYSSICMSPVKSNAAYLTQPNFVQQQGINTVELGNNASIDTFNSNDLFSMIDLLENSADHTEYENDAVSKSLKKESSQGIKKENPRNPQWKNQDQANMTFVRDAHGNNSLHYAVRRNDIATARDILTAAKCLGDKGKEFINAVNHMGLTPLHLSVLENQREVAVVLLKFGADPNLKDFNGNTPVHLAAMDKYLTDCLRLLLDKETTSAHINANNFKDRTPFQLAKRAGNSEGTKLLKENEAECQNISTSLWSKCGVSNEKKMPKDSKYEVAVVSFAMADRSKINDLSEVEHGTLTRNVKQENE